MNYIKDITDFIFIEDNIRKADIIFIPGGSCPEIAEKAALLWKDNIAPFILPTGKYSIKSKSFNGPRTKRDIYNKEYETEYMFLKDVLIKNGVNEKAILKEDKSTYTFQNAINSKIVLEENNIKINKAIICCQAFHARRCKMYYETVFKDVELLVCPRETQGISRDNWFKNDKGIDKVLGEIAKCGIQFKDIIKSYSHENFY